MKSIEVGSIRGVRNEGAVFHHNGGANQVLGGGRGAAGLGSRGRERSSWASTRAGLTGDTRWDNGDETGRWKTVVASRLSGAAEGSEEEVCGWLLSTLARATGAVLSTQDDALGAGCDR